MVRITVTLPEDTMKKAKSMAVEQKQTFSKFARESIKEYIEYKKRLYEKEG